MGAALRRLKAKLHLLTALCDLGGVWDLDQVTGALSDFADAAVRTALRTAAAQEVERGRLTAVGEGARGPVPGLFVVAMGKHGARELNYSSDIDISVFYEPDRLLLAQGAEPEKTMVRLTQAVASLLQDRTPEATCSASTCACGPTRPRPRPPCRWRRPGILRERRPELGAGGLHQGAAGGRRSPGGGALPGRAAAFVWRRNLDFAAIADIHSIKRQIHVHKVDDRLTAPGATSSSATAASARSSSTSRPSS